ncbi:hypothetical protein BV20DRAFT_854221 [Pilatotrama ljubarskyi]|nr:hypothetical protein BV20DRAFT_854221 [Pilatotrama ljubarskyi]
MLWIIKHPTLSTCAEACSSRGRRSLHGAASQQAMNHLGHMCVPPHKTTVHSLRLNAMYECSLQVLNPILTLTRQHRSDTQNAVASFLLKLEKCRPGSTVAHRCCPRSGSRPLLAHIRALGSRYRYTGSELYSANYTPLARVDLRSARGHPTSPTHLSHTRLCDIHDTDVSTWVPPWRVSASCGDVRGRRSLSRPSARPRVDTSCYAEHYLPDTETSSSQTSRTHVPPMNSAATGLEHRGKRRN